MYDLLIVGYCAVVQILCYQYYIYVMVAFNKSIDVVFVSYVMRLKVTWTC